MRNVRGWRAMACLVLICGLPLEARRVAGQPADDALIPMTLQEALRRAAAAHPGLAAASFGVVAAEARARQAAARPNPELGIEIENLSGDLNGAREVEASLRLAKRFELGGKRGARVAVAGEERSLAESDLETARHDLAREVRGDFVRGLAAQRELELARETLSIAQEVAASAQKKVEAGALPAVEAMRARVAISTAQIAWERARDESRLALERLALHWGGGPVPDQVEGSLDSLRAVPIADTLISRLADNPDLARFLANDRMRRARLRLERSRGNPDVELSGGLRRLEAEDQETFLLGLSVELPILDRNQGEVRAAAADLERSSLERERARRDLERELREQVARLRIAQAEVRGLRRIVLPGAQEVYEGVRKGYEQGRFTYLDVLEARRSLADARRAEIAALSELEQSRIEIDRLTGRGAERIHPAEEDGR